MNIVSALLLLFAATWISVKPVTKTVYIADASTADFVLPIRSATGHVTYTLVCYGPKSQPKANDFVYDGDFECRLTEASKMKSHYSTLLTDDPNQTRDWQSRGRFFGSELAGQCGEIPQFGRKRDFLLRGMRISLRIVDPTFTRKQELQSFTFSVSVQNDTDPIAQGQIAAAPTISRHWSELPCKLDNSVTPQFNRDE